MRMKTIKQYVETGILSLDDLKGALQLAMQLEFATIPPYLCAQWSIKHDPDRVEGVLHKIVSQEMYHFALAGNLLTAIGGRPAITNSEFFSCYPAKMLPGGIAQKIPVNLKPLDHNQLEVFMQIEYPDFPPVALLAATGPPTIGAFYDTIINTFQSLNPTIHPNAFAVEVPLSNPIKSVDDAIAAINRIKSEGEGLRDSPDQPSGERHGHAHYYLFKELYVQRRLVKVGDKWSFSGDPVQLPEVYNFKRSWKIPSPSIGFSQTLSGLIIDLEACWTQGQYPNVAAMFQLQIIGKDLIKRGIRPEFIWCPPDRSSASAVVASAFRCLGRCISGTISSRLNS
jgi:Ferritin-like